MSEQQLINLTDGDFNRSHSFSFMGDLYDIGMDVFRWDHMNGYNGYVDKKVVIKKNGVITKVIEGKRYSRRALRQKAAVNAITQLMIHHSGADRANPGVMYDVLYNQRGLSCHFAIEDDGRIFQFNDAIDSCWHAGKHNKISIGTECCLFPLFRRKPSYYNERNRRKTGNLPHAIRTEYIHGKRMKVFCFTQPQVEALARLYAGLWVAVGRKRTKPLPEFESAPIFPKVDGEITRTVAQGAKRHIGLIGHLQCTINKIDPAGFPWERFETLVERYFSVFSQNS